MLLFLLDMPLDAGLLLGMRSRFAVWPKDLSVDPQIPVCQ